MKWAKEAISSSLLSIILLHKKEEYIKKCTQKFGLT